MTPEDIAVATLIFLSAPVKPGGVHRLQPGWGYEARLAEAAVYWEAASEAFQRGRQLWRGERDSRTLALGSLVRAYAIRAFEKTGEKPMLGVLTSLVVASSLIGYSEASGGKASAALPRFVQYALYRSPSSEALSLLEAMEAVGASEYILHLDSRGVNRRTIELQGLPMGDVFEALSGVDSGFWLNLRSYGRVLDVAREAGRAESLVEASLAAFKAAAGIMGAKLEAQGVREALKLDAELRKRGVSLEPAMGGALAGLLLAYSEKPGLRLVPRGRG